MYHICLSLHLWKDILGQVLAIMNKTHFILFYFLFLSLFYLFILSIYFIFYFYFLAYYTILISSFPRVCNIHWQLLQVSCQINSTLLQKEYLRSQLHPTLCDPINCSPSGSSVHRISQEYWSELPFPLPGDLPHPGIEPASPAWQANSFLLCHW